MLTRRRGRPERVARRRLLRVLPEGRGILAGRPYMQEIRRAARILGGSQGLTLLLS